VAYIRVLQASQNATEADVPAGTSLDAPAGAHMESPAESTATPGEAHP